MKFNKDIAKFAVILVVVLVCGGIYFLRGGEKEIEPGACTDGADSSIEVVDCDDSEAQYKVVSSLGIATPGLPTPECEIGEAYKLTTEDTQRNFESLWCLVDSDDDSPEVEQAIKEAQAEQGDD